MRSFAHILALALFAPPLFSTRAADDADVRPLSPELREKCLTVLRTALEGEEFWPAMHAAEALTLAGEGKSVVPLLEARLKKDQDPQHRCGLVREIVRTGKREPLAILWKTLADTKSNGRVHAAESLYKIGEVGDGKLLRAAMQAKDDPKLQIMSAAALGRAGNQQAMELVPHRKTILQPANIRGDNPEALATTTWCWIRRARTACARCGLGEAASRIGAFRLGSASILASTPPRTRGSGSSQNPILDPT